MSSEKENKPEMQMIDLNKLNIQQLAQLKQQLDQELSLFQDSLQSLKIAQTKFQDSKESLDKITPESKGKEVMVPLTGSMYVPGRIADSEKVIIDVGTGYYLEKTVEDARDYFKRKIAFVTEQMEKIQAIGIEKSKIKEGIKSVIEEKLQSASVQQNAVASSSGT